MNTNVQTIHQMGFGINAMVKQATGRDSVSNIEHDWVSVEQLARYIYGSESGDIVSFDTNIPDGIVSLIAYITAVQDLNGYDNPWPAGGGKNLLGLAVSSVKTLNTNGAWNGNEYTLNGVTFKVIERDGYLESVECSGTSSSTSTLLLFNSETAIEANDYIFSGCPSGGGSSAYRFIIKDINSSSGGNSLYEAGSGLSIGNTFGIKRIAFTVYSDTTVTGKVIYPMLRLSSVTDGDFAPYTNICPITGWTGAKVSRCGANLHDSSTDTAGYYISANGTITASVSYSYSALIPVTEGQKYIFRGHNSRDASESKRLHGYDSSGNWVRQIGYVNAPALGDYSLVETIPTGIAYIRISFRTTDTGIYVAIDDEFAVSWQTEAGTVYSGYWNVLSGVLTVTHKSMTFVGAENEEWITVDNAGYHIYRISVPDASFTITPIRTPVLCNIGKYAESGNDIGVCFIIPVSGVSSFYYYPPTEVDSVAKFKTWLSSNNLQIVYQLAEPITYQMTAYEVTALVGETNNIFADTGNVSVEYKVKEDLL